MEKFGGKTGKPGRPVRLRGAEIRQPGKRRQGLVELLKQRGHRDAGRSCIPDGAATDVPFNCGGEGWEGFGAGAEVGFHGSKGVHCAAFDNVEDGVAKELKVEEAVVRRMCYYSTAEGVAHY